MPNDKTAELLAELAAGAADLETSDGWQRWLETQSKFYRYSFGNTLLILRQMPGASAVAGFHKWLELHRYVKRGEHGIRILAPCVVKVKPGQDQDDDATEPGGPSAGGVSRRDGIRHLPDRW